MVCFGLTESVVLRTAWLGNLPPVNALQPLLMCCTSATHPYVFVTNICISVPTLKIRGTGTIVGETLQDLEMGGQNYLLPMFEPFGVFVKRVFRAKK